MSQGRKAIVLYRRTNGRRMKPRALWIPTGDADRLVQDKRAVFISRSIYKAMEGRMDRAKMETTVPQSFSTDDGTLISVWETQ